MDNAHIPNAAPQAIYTGKVRSFWAIVGLTFITCGIYYVVYNFMVASELKRATNWRDDESYKPGTYQIMFGAYVVLGRVFPMMFGLAIGAKVFMAIMANPNNPDPNMMSNVNPYEIGMQVFMVLVNLVGYYVAYYFLKINDIAAEKVGARPIGIRPAFIALTIFMAAVMLQSLVSILMFALDINSNFGNFESLREAGPAMALFGMMIGVGILTAITGLYFLWKQTELVNYVWEAGVFAHPAGGYGSYSPPPQGSQTMGAQQSGLQYPAPGPTAGSEVNTPTDAQSQAKYGPPPAQEPPQPPHPPTPSPPPPPPTPPSGPPKPPELPDGESV